MSRIKYTCKNCGWVTSVTAQWADLKPKRCMNAKCNTNFAKEPKMLLIDDPTKKTKDLKSKVKFEGKPNKLEDKVEKDVKTSSKSKKSSKTKQQQTEKENSQ